MAEPAELNTSYTNPEDVMANDFDELEFQNFTNIRPEEIQKANWKRLNVQYGISSYTTVIREYVEDIMPEKARHFNELVTDSIKNYSIEYERIKKEFLKDTSRLDISFNRAQRDIRSKISGDLFALQARLELDLNIDKPMQELAEKVERLTGQKIDVSGNLDDQLADLEADFKLSEIEEDYRILMPAIKAKLKRSFGSYIDALNEYYLNTDWYKAQNPNLSEDDIEEYEDAADDFGDEIKGDFENELAGLLDNEDGETGIQDLIQFKRKIERKYRFWSNLDERGGIISPEDMELHEKVNTEDMEALEKTLTTSTEEEDIEMVEQSPSETKHNLYQYTKDGLINTARNDPEAFMKKADEWYEKNEEDKKIEKDENGRYFKTLEEAEAYFDLVILDAYNAGTDEFIEVQEYFNVDKKSPATTLIKSLEPPSFRQRVSIKYSEMMHRKDAPTAPHEQYVHYFVAKENIHARKEILNDPKKRKELIWAIKNIIEHYGTQYDERYDDPESTKGDKAVHLQVMIIMAKQAEWIMDNYSKGGTEWSEEWTQAKADESAPIHQGTFASLKPGSKPIAYLSDLEQNGFNGTDLAIKGVKVMATFCAIANFLNSFKDAEGTGIDKILNGLERAITNPAVLVSVGLAGATHMYEMYPQLKKYPWVDSHEKASIITGIQIDRIAKNMDDYTHKEIKEFVAKDSEWEAMEQISASDARDLMKKVSTRKTKRGVILAKDIEEYLETNRGPIVRKIASQDNDRQSRARYLFYSKFLSANEENRINITELHKMCDKMRHYEYA